MRNIRTLYGRLVPHTLTWSFCVKAEVKLVGLLLRVVPLVFGQLSSSLVKVTYGYAKNVRRIYKSSGPRGLAIYLKTAYLLLQHAAGGMSDASPWALGANVARTRRGIPRIINPQHRRLISQGDVRVIGFWLSLFGLYRVIEFKGALKLTTITDPGVSLLEFRQGWVRWIPEFYSRLRRHTGDKIELQVDKDLTPWFFPLIRKASPNSGGFAAVMSLPWDLALYGSDRQVRTAICRWLDLTDGLDLLWGLKPIWEYLERRAFAWWTTHLNEFCSSKGKGLRSTPLGCRYRGNPCVWLEVGTRPKGVKEFALGLYLESFWAKYKSFGALGFKEEPGKIRVFAMVPLFLQTLMEPLHKWIFSKLRLISTDGTFNQVAPVERLLERIGDADFVASYDLSAATDRLPLQLQVDLLVPLLGAEMSSLWAFLLVGRPYRLPRIAKSYNLGIDRVSYAVGQPMGALSSWAMLALTHHALVQYAASNAYPKRTSWFVRYAVLGDDVVIADRLVAAEYLRVMKSIGVGISLAKSLISCTSSLEFAKRTWIRKREVTPVSLAEMLVSLRNVGALEQLVLKLKRFGEIRIAAVARFAGFGFRNLARLPVGLGLGNRLSGLIAYLCRPGGVFSMPLEAWLISTAPGGKEGALLDLNAWKVSERLWGQIIRTLLRQLVSFDKLQYSIATLRFTDVTFKSKPKGGDRKGSKDRRRGKDEETSGRKKFWSEGADEFFGITEQSVMWNEFFSEWIIRKFSETLRARFEKIDDVLRVLDPNILPDWRMLEDVWKQVFEAEEGVNSLPSSFEIALRENEELPTSTRLITLWRALRQKATRERAPSVTLTTDLRLRPEARRRRRGG